TKIYSTATGTVVKAGTNGAYGRMVEVDHGNGFKTRYGHMKRVRVKIGQIVKRGDIVGDMGCTGRCTSTHLHYEVWFGGKPRNPMPYVRKAQSIIELENTLNNIDTSVALEDE
ncbi:MAG: M23 family metallopeptidase, partial [Sphingomonadales bacterium]|nr:M23 family metallopeptidase [Sphingomonadales bacterium]